MGPAEQDLLRDLLLSALYNRTVVVRKYSLARDAAMGYADGARLAGTLVNRSSMPHCSRAAIRRNPDWGESACLGAGVVDEHDLDPLPAVPGVVFSKRAFGTVHGNVYNGTVHFHLHVGPRMLQGSSPSSKEPRTAQPHAPEVASYLAAIAGKLK